MTPFCDYLSVSTPHLDRAEPFPLLDSVLGWCDFTCEGADATTIRYRGPNDGLVSVRRVGSVSVASASGLALLHLRESLALDQYLHTVGTNAHRVTRIDVALDVACDAAPVLRAVAAKARAGHLFITDRAVRPADVTTYEALGERGELTGTVYLAPPTAEVRPKLYDKEHEQLVKWGRVIPPTLRIEITCRSKVRATLRDAAVPRDLFYHYAAPGLLSAPADARPWSPHAEGFVLPPPNVLDPALLLERRCDRSADLLALVRLASAYPRGLRDLHARIDQIARGLPGQDSGATAGASAKAPPGAEAVPAVRPLN